MASLAGNTSIRIVDLACGTGSTLRALAPRFPAGQNWRLADNDLSLLARASAMARPAGVTLTTVPLDLNRDLEAALDGPIDLVTTSALLDLVSEAWLDRLAVETLARSIPIYAALSYDGRIEISPSNPFDAAIVTAVNAHQRGDKGFGPALGPAAASAAIARFESLGCSVIHGKADWVIGPHDREFQMEIFVRLGERGARARRSVARRHGRMADLATRRRRRRTLINPRRSCRYFRAADRHTLSRQVAVEQYLVVELMGAYRHA